MPDLPITGLPAITEPGAGDLYAIVNGGVTSKVTRANNSKIITESTAKTSNYTFTANDETIKFDTSSGSITASLPTAVGIKGKWYVAIKTSANNTLTIDPDGSETINGSSTYAITNNNATVTMQSDGSNWYVTSIGVQGAGTGDVTGPSSSTDNALVRFDSTSGKLIQNSTAILSDTGALDTANVTADYLQIDTAATPPTLIAGTIAWDSGNGTLELGLLGGNSTLKIGEQQYTRVYNDTASTMTKGQVVYISGAQGNRVAVRLARADAESTSKNTIGLVAESIAAGAEGWVLSAGTLGNLNTNSLTAGNTIYLSPTTAGDYTTTRPTAPDNTVILGFVQRVSATVGSLYLKVDNGYELDELHDVLVTSPQNGQLLIRDQTAGVWENAYLTAGSNITITNTAGAISIATTNPGLVDGDKGDITVSGSGGTWTIDSGAVGTSKLGGDITTAGKALLDDADAAAQRTTLGLGTLATQNGTFSGTSSGTNTGDQTITLTGDVTGSGTGSFAATIANDVVTYAKIQNVSATDKILGRSSSGAGDVEEITCTSAGRALLDDADAAAQRTTLSAQKTITSGTASPTGGSDGDIYLQYV